MPQPTRIRRSSALTETTAPSTYLLSKGGKALPSVRVGLAGAARRDSMGAAGVRARSSALNCKAPAGSCIAPGTVERLPLSVTMYGGYTNDSNSLLDFRLRQWRRPFAINPRKRGFFDLAGTWRGPDLVMNRRQRTGRSVQLRIVHRPRGRDAAVGELRAFEAACNAIQEQGSI